MTAATMRSTVVRETDGTFTVLLAIGPIDTAQHALWVAKGLEHRILDTYTTTGVAEIVSSIQTIET